VDRCADRRLRTYAAAPVHRPSSGPRPADAGRRDRLCSGAEPADRLNRRRRSRTVGTLRRVRPGVAEGRCQHDLTRCARIGRSHPPVANHLVESTARRDAYHSVALPARRGASHSAATIASRDATQSVALHLGRRIRRCRGPGGRGSRPNLVKLHDSYRVRGRRCVDPHGRNATHHRCRTCPAAVPLHRQQFGRPRLVVRVEQDERVAAADRNWKMVDGRTA
jgi:hypothetical protein